ncbi:MAG: PKD domain-containing protein, partial [Bacteroidota bacterium]
MKKTLLLLTTFILFGLFAIPTQAITANRDCEADFYFDRDSVNQTTVYFYDLSNSIYSIYSWTWDFGDGTTSSLQNPVHTFGQAGIFFVCLTIESGDSNAYCTDTYCMEIDLTSGGGNDCLADFNYTIDTNGS